jgi:hypothetical protein
MAMQINKKWIMIAAADFGAGLVYFCAIRWLMPHSGSWSGLVFVSSVIAVAALVIQSQVLRRRLKEK